MSNRELQVGDVVGRVVCETCGKQHDAEFSHYSQWGNHHAVFAVVCTEDGLTDYYTKWALV